jgi:transposase
MKEPAILKVRMILYVISVTTAPEVAPVFVPAVYVFRAKRADRVKLIYWDGNSVRLFAKWNGGFRRPNNVRDVKFVRIICQREF